MGFVSKCESMKQKQLYRFYIIDMVVGWFVSWMSAHMFCWFWMIENQGFYLKMI